MSQQKGEVYISVDIEASGPVPSEYSMLSLGACVVGDGSKSFYAELKPVTDKFVPEAMAVSKLNLEQLHCNGEKPAEAMYRFAEWLIQVAGNAKPVFVGFNASFDWAFVNWYFCKFSGKNPFGIGGIDIKAYYMGMAGVTWDQTRSSQLPPEFQPASKQTHNALEDARSQAEIFQKLLLAGRNRARP
jgi:DNA polymerase III epsilon subunit-like protein